MSERLITHGHLYHLFQGMVRRYEGMIFEINARTGRARFTSDDNKSLTCGLEEGVYHNSTVWLKHRDDDRAIDIFIEHEQKRLKELTTEIDIHNYRLKALEKRKKK